VKEQIKKIIMDNEYFHSETAYSYCIDEEHAELLATRLDKAIGIDRDKTTEIIIKEIHGIKYPRPNEIAQAITQQRPLKCEVGE